MEMLALGLSGAAVVLLIVLLVVTLCRRSPESGVAASEQRLREELRALRRELNDTAAALTRQQAEQQTGRLRVQAEEQERLYRTLNAQSERVSASVREAVARLQESNEQKLEQMRATVDEKLSATLSQRLDTSFQAVGEQLQNVYRSLGEMRELAGGVADLQRALTNVKVRGTWAEVQLGSLLEQTLTPDQFARNVSVRNNAERVEYAVKIPSPEEDGQIVWLPIDSKFPQEDYLRLSEAAERGDRDATEAAAKALERLVKKEAEDIARLYIAPPQTTDFAVMFLPTEGLYAEVLRRPGLAEELQRKCRVMVCGPTTLTAFLNTLRMGFRTIALDRRAAEVWKVLGAAKAQYEQFGAALERAQRKIEEAGSSLDAARHRNEIIRKKLRTVEDLPAADAGALLGDAGSGSGESDGRDTDKPLDAMRDGARTDV